MLYIPKFTKIIYFSPLFFVKIFFVKISMLIDGKSVVLVPKLG